MKNQPKFILCALILAPASLMAQFTDITVSNRAEIHDLGVGGSMDLNGSIFSMGTIPTGQLHVDDALFTFINSQVTIDAINTLWLQNRSRWRTGYMWSWDVPNAADNDFEKALVLTDASYANIPHLAANLSGGLYSAVPIYIKGQPVLTPGTVGNISFGDPSVSLASVWYGAHAIGQNGLDKVVVGPLASSVNGATIGAHNSDLNAWRNLNLAGSVLTFRTNGEHKTAEMTSDGLRIFGGLTVDGNKTSFGKFGGQDIPGMSIRYTDGGASLTTFHSNRWGASWRWEHDTDSPDPVPQMDLTGDNRLVLWDSPVGVGTATVSLNPKGDSWLGGGGIIVGGASAGSGTFQRYNDSSSIGLNGHEILNWAGGPFQSQRTHLLTYAENPQADDGVVGIISGTVSSPNHQFVHNEFRLGSYNFSGADIVLFPGQTKVLTAKASGKVGIGTDSPHATLDVAGDARFSGRVRVSEQGDLSMGRFQEEPLP